MQPEFRVTRSERLVAYKVKSIRGCDGDKFGSYQNELCTLNKDLDKLKQVCL